MHKTIS